MMMGGDLVGGGWRVAPTRQSIMHDAYTMAGVWSVWLSRTRGANSSISIPSSSLYYYVYDDAYV